MKNKGFSLIELIVVIAIIAIIAGALTPMLIRYINKARMGVDIRNGKDIADAIVVALANEDIRDNAVEHATPQGIEDMDGNEFKNAVCQIVDLDKIQGRSRKDADGATISDRKFYYTLESDKNKIAVYYGGITDDYQVYPKTGKKIVK